MTAKKKTKTKTKQNKKKKNQKETNKKKNKIKRREKSLIERITAPSRENNRANELDSLRSSLRLVSI